MITLRRSNQRGHASHGWLDSHHTFSFADYYDPQWNGFGNLRVINDDFIAPGMGFGKHPHRDMEIITFMLSGELKHEDSMGNGRIIRAGEFQYMAAGTGVVHSEFNSSATTQAHLLQMWIVPDSRGAQPRYAEKSANAAAFGQLLLVASKSGREESIAINQDADLWLGKFEGGEKVIHEIGAGRHAWVHLAEGEVTLNGSVLTSGDAAAFEEEPRIELSATKSAQILIFDLKQSTPNS